MKDPLDDLRFYQKALELWDLFWEDSKVLIRDIRVRKIAEQMTKSVGSISANIEEGYGRGYGNKEYTHFLKISRGSASESKGWYRRANRLLPKSVASARTKLLNEVIAMLTKSIKTLERR